MAASELEEPTCRLAWHCGSSDQFRLRSAKSHHAGTGTGLGFSALANHIPGSLLTLLQDVAALEQLLTCYSSGLPLANTFNELLNMRNAVVHEVLALPHWQSLPTAELLRYSGTIYELCRQTALLYANAVLVGLPLQGPWRLRLLAGLRDVFELIEDVCWVQAHRSFLTWSLTLTGIVSQGTPFEGCFKNIVRRLLVDGNAPPWSSIKQDLLHFLWNDQAGEEAAIAFWHALDCP
jgi:hypothetical protein